MQKAFTLIEVLIVISIIGILASVAFVSFNSAQKQARDTRRKSDIKGYQSSLEIYANKNNGLYPNQSSVVPIATLCNNLGIVNCPNDPKTPAATYNYVSTGGSGAVGSPNATSYVLWGTLEASDAYFVTCSNGKTATMPTTTSITGTCPL